MRLLFLIFGLLLFSNSFCQDIDVLHYTFQIEITDKSDSIYGKAGIELQLLKPTSEISLDLARGKNEGMTVYNITGGNVLRFRQENNKLMIQLKSPIAFKKLFLEIQYSGIPSNGLVISQNKFGERTFFADNWPDRAHYWIPCNDVPGDKASFEFLVIAPDHYKIISNGFKVGEIGMSEKRKLTHWKEDVRLSTKVMVIGAAHFSVVEYADSPNMIPVSAWVFPQDSLNGFHDYSTAPGILKFFSGYIGPFPYNKLANVQSKTKFGGMENASAIFYNEELVRGDGKLEEVMAHEIAHQWFGDMASEKSFAHLWLSEGFATYFTNLYIAYRYGMDSARKIWERERNETIGFSQENQHPVVDTTSDFVSLLNVNSYQKGGWVLYMLRNKTGEVVFQKIIRAYYDKYKGNNADTRDFESVVEKVTGKNYKWFFDQWLYKPGIPEIKLYWKFEGNSVSGSNKLILKFAKSKSFKFFQPLDVLFEYEDGSKEIKQFDLSSEQVDIILENSKRPVSLLLDPNIRLLFSGMVEPM